MIFPPSFLHYRNAPHGTRRIGCWLPLFLLWPILLAVGLVVMAIQVLRALLGGGWRTLTLVPRLCVLFCRIRGLRVDFDDDERRFRLRLI
jgi:hypothetical protein